MEKTEVYDIYFDGDLPGVVMNWEGYATSKQFRQGTELMLNILIHNKAAKVLADVKDMVLIGSEDQQWMNEEFIPRAIRFGMKRVAIVRPKAYFNKVAVETISYKVDQDKLRISFFDNTDEAREWLLE